MVNGELHLKIGSAVLTGVLFCTLLALAGCSHKLVGHSGETTVSVYPSKNDFDSLTSMKSRGAAGQMMGGIGETFIAKKVAENTQVKILSSDAEGAEVEILQGPNAGLRGYVAKDNVK
jgi:ABC-type oligopeptide transport system substrate-binding subunit